MINQKLLAGIISLLFFIILFSNSSLLKASKTYELVQANDDQSIDTVETTEQSSAEIKIPLTTSNQEQILKDEAIIIIDPKKSPNSRLLNSELANICNVCPECCFEIPSDIESNIENNQLIIK